MIAVVRRINDVSVVDEPIFRQRIDNVAHEVVDRQQRPPATAESLVQITHRGVFHRICRLSDQPVFILAKKKTEVIK